MSVGLAAPAQEAPVPAPTLPLPQQQPNDTAPALPPYAPLPQTQPQSPGSAPGDAPVLPSATPTAPPTVMPAPPTAPFSAYQPYGLPDEDRLPDHDGSTYIPVDSWMYPAIYRLYSLGYLGDSVFLSMRPWTRRSVLRMVMGSEDDILQGDDVEAQEILADILDELEIEAPGRDRPRGAVYGLYSAYDRAMGIGGPILRDSYHIGQTIVNDYGRPYQTGFNNLLGFSTVNEWKRFSLHVRGEYQHAPSAAGYSQALSAYFSDLDEIPFEGANLHQATIPTGPIPSANPFRLVEATLSFHILGHEISGGKSDAWLGPAQGGSLAWSNNAENIYSFRINRVEPLYIPYVSKVLGPVRYDFFYGDLKGHTYPNDPYIHSEMFSFHPTPNFEFGFQRTIIFGGKGHEPVTLHTFLRGFFDINDTTAAEKYSREDPGARFSDFVASYRLPFVRNYMTFYVDSITHDDVTPISAPRRASFRTGLYLSQIPRARRFDLRVEAVLTDPRVTRSFGGQFNYFEIIQRQGYTNKGYILGDWMGREGKGGQAWLTYHMGGKQWVEVEYLNKKNAKDFITLGTTQNQFKVSVVKRLLPDVELNAWVQYERWKAPIYMPGQQSDTIGAAQVTFYPRLHSTEDGK